MEKAIYSFENGVKVYRKHLLDLQVDRYQEINLHEPIEEEQFTQILQSTHESPFVLVDIGAAIGYYCLLAKKLHPDAIIYAFEPLASHRQYMKDNFDLNQVNMQNIFIRSEALSDHNGTAKFQDNSFGSSLVKPHKQKHGLWRQVKDFLKNRKPSVHAKPIEDVEIITFDSFAKALKHPISLAKVDVQGFELEVLRGAIRTIESGLVKHWIVGTHSTQLHQATRAFMLEYGYELLFDEEAVAHQPDGIIVAKYGQ